jgi:hypothetical protein
VSNETRPPLPTGLVMIAEPSAATSAIGSPARHGSTVFHQSPE